MPVSLEQDGRLFVIRCVGEYDGREVTAALDAIVERGDLPADPQMLLDVRRADSILHKPINEMRIVADHFSKRAGVFGSRCGLLVEGDARYGLMRMAAMWVEQHGIEAQVFVDENEARTWLLSGSP